MTIYSLLFIDEDENIEGTSRGVSKSLARATDTQWQWRATRQDNIGLLRFGMENGRSV